jgi:hypothetical protein
MFWGIALVDGSARYGSHRADRNTWSELLLIADGRPTTAWEQSLAAGDNSRIPRIGNWVRLAIFLVVAVFPLPWVWLNANSGRDGRMNPASTQLSDGVLG